MVFLKQHYQIEVHSPLGPQISAFVDASQSALLVESFCLAYGGLCLTTTSVPSPSPLLDSLPRRAQPLWSRISSLSRTSLNICLSDHVLIAPSALIRSISFRYVKTPAQTGCDPPQIGCPSAPTNKDCPSGASERPRRCFLHCWLLFHRFQGCGCLCKGRCTY